jgi:murein endopeptidase
VLIAGAGQVWGDFSNMNGGSFAPDHTSHQTGNSADGWFDGYNARDADVAATIIGHVNTHGRRIRTVYVTFAPNSAFANAIAGVTLNDGRAATEVIRNFRGHTGHFHWEVTD